MVKITEGLVRKKSEHNECLISTLEELSLHQEDIERIEHLQNWCRDLKILLLQSNLIPKIENLHKLKRLEYLNLALNNIVRVENLQQLESLNKLDLTLNFIGDLTSIESLRGNYNLRELILTGNPCCEYPNYRDYVIATLPQLTSLDSLEITKTQQLQAQLRLQQNRAIILQKQLNYAIQRDEQKLRVQQQQQALENEMATMESEEERLKAFWNAKSEHCPETRIEMAKYQKLSRQQKGTKKMPVTPNIPTLFAPCGRPYNLNQAKLTFNFQDEAAEYILKLDVYRHLDTSLLTVDIETNYIRVTIKNKIFQISLAEEVKTTEATVQRSQITGQLLIKVPKLNYNEILKPIKLKKDKTMTTDKTERGQRTTELKGTVDISKICASYSNLPPLVRD